MSLCIYQRKCISTTNTNASNINAYRCRKCTKCIILDSRSLSYICAFLWVAVGSQWFLGEILCISIHNTLYFIIIIAHFCTQHASSYTQLKFKGVQRSTGEKCAQNIIPLSEWMYNGHVYCKFSTSYMLGTYIAHTQHIHYKMYLALKIFSNLTPLYTYTRLYTCVWKCRNRGWWSQVFIMYIEIRCVYAFYILIYLPSEFCYTFGVFCVALWVQFASCTWCRFNEPKNRSSSNIIRNIIT